MRRASTRTRLLPWASAAGAALLLVGPLGGGAAAAPEQPAQTGAFDLTQASYLLTMRAAAVEPYAFIPRDLPTQIGYSYVDLIHDIGQQKGRCEAIGAGYWLGVEVEEGVLGAGAAPPDAGDVSGGYKNPTISREVLPNLSPGEENLSNKDPGLKDPFPFGVPAPGAPPIPDVGLPNEIADIPAGGNGPHWVGDCADDLKGSGTGTIVDLPGAAGLAGSTTTAEVNRETGVYTGTARGFVTEIGVPGSQVDTITSLMQVKNEPNKEPVVSYRMSFGGADAGGSRSGLNQDAFTIGGMDVPVADLVQQFNQQVKNNAPALAALGPAGFQLLAPEVGTSTDGGRYSISAPVIAGNLGLTSQQGTIGMNQGVRIGTANFQGTYQDFSA